MREFVAIAFLFVALSAQAASAVSLGKADQSVERVSLISLIANPDKYDGKRVRAIGAFRLEFEGNAFCLHKEDLVQRIYENCVWVEPDLKVLGTDYKTLSQLNGEYVLFEGTFHKDDHGHRGLFSGAITGIWRAASLPPSPK
jgi:hypothetical protein